MAHKLIEAAEVGAFFDPSDVGSIEYFANLGHVGLTGVYQPETVDTAIGQLPTIVLRNGDAIGEQKWTESIGPNLAYNKKDLEAFLGGFGEQALMLGAGWPDGRDYRLKYLAMQPGTVGLAHTDEDVYEGAGAINSLREASSFRIEGYEYPLVPGNVVYFDNSRRPLHQGIASSEGERVGMVVGKLKS